jgi:putative transposase
MRKSRFTEEPMVKILREADKVPLAEVAKKHGVSEGTLYVSRRRFGTMDVLDTKRLKALEAENGRLKRLVAERDLEIEVMKEIAAKNGERARSRSPDSVPEESAGQKCDERAPIPLWRSFVDARRSVREGSTQSAYARR